MTTLRVATRGSELALVQARIVAETVRSAGGQADVVEVSTEGDAISRRFNRDGAGVAPAAPVGQFTAAVTRAVLEGRADVAVHSLKDLPAAGSEGMALVAVLEREDPRDALVARDGAGLDDLPDGARVGTASPRRAAQVRAARPDLRVEPVRGNVPTRLERVSNGDLDAVVLAVAGLRRLDLADRITEVLDPERFTPAAGQGAVAVEARAGDAAAAEACAGLDHAPTRAATTAERAAMDRLGAGCTAPVGIHGRLDGDVLHLRAWIGRGDAAPAIAAVSGAPDDPAALADAVVEQLAAAGVTVPLPGDAS